MADGCHKRGLREGGRRLGVDGRGEGCYDDHWIDGEYMMIVVVIVIVMIIIMLMMIMLIMMMMVMMKSMIK